MRTMLAALAAAATIFVLPAAAADFEIKMLNKGADGQAMVFEPAFLKVAPGDTVTFTATYKSHNVQAIPELIPAGAEPFKGEMNKSLTVTLTTPGAYVVKCLPHFAMGMIAVIEVGEAPANVDAVKAAKLPGTARKRLDAALAQLGL
jgi:pseudoazurin